MGRGRFAVRYVEKGSTTDAPVRTKSSTLRVTRVSPCTLAVAANKPSMRGSRLGMPSTAHASAIGSSTGSTRSPRRLRICPNQRSKDRACSGSRRRVSSMPQRISASTMTLVPISSTGVSATHLATFGCARSRLRSSKMMFVSSRNLTALASANLVRAVGRTRLQRLHRGDPSRIYRTPSSRPD